MSFDLTSAPHTFQKAMNSTLYPLLRKCVLVFFDDILLYSKSYEDHLVHLELVLELLRKEQWSVKLSKCSFASREISYLGYVIIEKAVATCPDKVNVVQNWHAPTSVKELRSFLGLVGYYRKFIRHFGMISSPLTDLLNKAYLFVWTNEQDMAFQTLKQALVQAPVLALPDFFKVFYIETNACECGVGAVLIPKGHPMAFVSKALGLILRDISTYEKEYIAILMSNEQWRSYL
jgi:hypothetical protein